MDQDGVLDTPRKTSWGPFFKNIHTKVVNTVPTIHKKPMTDCHVYPYSKREGKTFRARALPNLPMADNKPMEKAKY